jgi:hypothetical protein
MNNPLINLFNAPEINRVVDSLSIATGENSGLSLAEILIVSRILFAVVMIGFIGHFFDRIKQALFENSKATAKYTKNR